MGQGASVIHTSFPAPFTLMEVTQMQSIILNSFFNPKSHNDRNDNIIKLPDQCMNDLMILLGKQEGVNVKSPLTKYDWTVKMCKKPVIATKYLVVVVI